MISQLATTDTDRKTPETPIWMYNARVANAPVACFPKQRPPRFRSRYIGSISKRRCMYDPETEKFIRRHFPAAADGTRPDCACSKKLDHSRGSPRHDGAAWDQGPSSRSQRQCGGSESRRLRRVRRQSVSRLSPDPPAQKWPSRHDPGDVVELAPA